jgi:superfamily II DNA/RNA helicase
MATNYENFQNLNLDENLLKGVYMYGFKSPSKIQIKGIKTIASKNDCILQSQSGTGKTATYLLSIINRYLKTKKKAIVISPTRELAFQIYDVAKQLSKYIDINLCLTTGGIGFKENQLKVKDAHIIIGTIGRINHVVKYYMSKDIVLLNGFNTLVFDEADNILKPGDNTYSDYNGLKNILGNMSDDKQTILISATLTQEVFNYSKKHMTDIKKVLLKRTQIAVDLISQFYIDTEVDENKFSVMMDLYSILPTTQTIIFCNTIRKLDWLAKELTKEKFTITCIHGKMNQEERNKIVKDFREGKTRVLLTTDILARGIDIPQVNLVINYDLPINKETYIHRIGRCGRFGKKGVSISLINFQDYKDNQQYKRFKNHYQMEIKEMPNNISDYL